MKKIWTSSDNHVTKTILVEGTFSNKPVERSVCKIRVEDVISTNSDATYQDENTVELFGSEYLAEPAEKSVTIGNANATVDRYLERAIQMMFFQETALISITLDDPDMPHDKTIRLECKLTLWAYEPYKPIWEWSAREKYDIALLYKQMGVELHKLKRRKDAFHKFSKACKILITLEPLDDDIVSDQALKNDIITLRNVLYNNMAECQLICGNFEHTMQLCDKVLAREGDNVKALYRRGVAHASLKDFEKAASDMERVTILEVKNSAAKEKLGIYRKEVDKATKKYNSMVKKMFPLE